MEFDETGFYKGEVLAIKKYGYKLEVPENTIFKHLDKKRVATKKTPYGTIEIFMSTAPAHFFSFIVPTQEEKLFCIETGSGGLDDYLENMQTTIELINKSMVEINEQKTKYDVPV
jgi:hypothetical protein